MRQRSFLIFDLETVPDYEVYAVPELPAGTDRPIPPPYAHVPVVIGVLWLDHDYSFKRLGVVGEGRDEAGALADFGGFVEKQRPHLVTFNGRGFDLPVIMLRALRHGVPLPWYYRDKGYRYRYSDEGHIDLCDLLAEHGAIKFLSLHAAARLVGLPGKLDVDGSQVESLYRGGQLDRIRRYCLADVAQTAFLFLRLRLVQGHLALDEYQRAARALHQALVDDGRLPELLESIDLDRLLLADAAG